MHPLSARHVCNRNWGHKCVCMPKLCGGFLQLCVRGEQQCVMHLLCSGEIQLAWRNGLHQLFSRHLQHRDWGHQLICLP